MESPGSQCSAPPFWTPERLVSAMMSIKSAFLTKVWISLINVTPSISDSGMKQQVPARTNHMGESDTDVQTDENEEIKRQYTNNCGAWNEVAGWVCEVFSVTVGTIRSDGGMMRITGRGGKWKALKLNESSKAERSRASSESTGKYVYLCQSLARAQVLSRPRSTFMHQIIFGSIWSLSNICCGKSQAIHLLTGGGHFYQYHACVFLTIKLHIGINVVYNFDAQYYIDY